MATFSQLRAPIGQTDTDPNLLALLKKDQGGGQSSPLAGILGQIGNIDFSKFKDTPTPDASKIGDIYGPPSPPMARTQPGESYASTNRKAYSYGNEYTTPGEYGKPKEPQKQKNNWAQESGEILSGASKGASIGSVAGPIGTAIGALIGSALGFFG